MTRLTTILALLLIGSIVTFAQPVPSAAVKLTKTQQIALVTRLSTRTNAPVPAKTNITITVSPPMLSTNDRTALEGSTDGIHYLRETNLVTDTLTLRLAGSGHTYRASRQVQEVMTILQRDVDDGLYQRYYSEWLPGIYQRVKESNTATNTFLQTNSPAILRVFYTNVDAAGHESPPSEVATATNQVLRLGISAQ